MDRPYIICHMLASIDGKVTGEFLQMPISEAAVDVYYEINRSYHADAFACGRVTMEESFTRGWFPDLTRFLDAKIPREDYVANSDAGFFAVMFDRNGSLGWKSSKIEDDDPGYGNAHIIEVLCEGVADAYLAYLKSIGVSYIFAGTDEMNVTLAVEKLRKLFGIKQLLIEGGSVINGAFQREDVIDELSLVIVPAVADADDKPLFYNSQISSYELRDIKKFNNNVLWVNYKRKKVNNL